MGKLSALTPDTSPGLTHQFVMIPTSGNDVRVPVSAIAALLTPPGMMVAYAGSTAPTGWLLCDGSAVSRSTYAALFAIISTAYGVGNGTTTFNLPDLRGSVVAGRKASDANFGTLGQIGGEVAHTLTIGEIPAHHHGLPGLANRNYAGSGFNPVDPDSHEIAANTDDTGGGGSHNNLQPYQVANYIIKT